MARLSYQLYSSRAFPPLGDTLHMLADLGYAEVEGYGDLYEDLPRLRAALDEAGLVMSSGHFSLEMLEAEPARVLEIARAVGMRTLYCPFLQADLRPADAAGYRAFGERLSRLARPFADAGLGFGWHNHDFELQPLSDGAIPLAEIFAGGPDLSWEADIAWIARAGADPEYWIGRLSQRISAVHIKDIAPAGQCMDEDGWADVGHGTMNWTAIWAALGTTPASIFVIEHDRPSDHRRFARRSIEAVREFERRSMP